MNCLETGIDGLKVLEPRIFEDDRGYFFEPFNQEKFNQVIGKKVSFVQDNESLSSKGVLRGLHFQNPPYEQGKLVRVIKGSVLDVAVDIRKNSKTYGQWVSIELNEKNKKQLWIPPGFAHGFQTLEDNTIFAYKCTNFYQPQSEGAIRWDDSDLNIQWRKIEPILSDKDKISDFFRNFVSVF